MLGKGFPMSTRSIVVISAGLSQPSSTRLLADRLADGVVTELAARGITAHVETVELRDVAHEVVNMTLSGFASGPLKDVIEKVTAADGVIAVTPIFSASYSGLFKSFVDILDKDALVGRPVLVGATGGTGRHSLAPVGTMTFTFTDAQNAAMSYTIDGVSGTNALTRLPF